MHAFQEIWKEMNILKNSNIAPESFFIPPPKTVKQVMLQERFAKILR